MKGEVVLIIFAFKVFIIGIAETRSLVFDPNPIAELNINILYNENTFFSSITQDNNHAFLASGVNGVYIISLVNKINPKVIGNIKTREAIQTAYQNGILCIADIFQGVIFYNMTDIANPVLLYEWQIAKRIQSLTITRDSEYVFALGNGIVYVININDAHNPQTIDYTGVMSPSSYKIKLSGDESHICVSNHVQGVQIYDVRIKNQIQLRANQNPVYVTWDCIFTPDQTTIYAVDAYYGLFYANVQSIFSTPQGSTATYTLTFKNAYGAPQLHQSVAITSDGLYLILGLRSVGLILFEIQNSNYQSPVFVQRLNGNYLADDVYFSYNNQEMYAFMTNGMALLIFKQAQINTNKDFPNIFNTFSSSLTYLNEELFPWKVVCLKQSSYLIETSSGYGAGFYDISNPQQPKKVGSLPTRNGEFGGLALNNNENIMFLAASQNGLEFYDISNISAPIFIKNYTPLDPTLYMNAVVGVCLDRSGNILVLSNGYYGFAILDVSDPLNHQQIGLFVNTQYPCGFEYCVITSDIKTIICACREIGLFFYDFDNYNLQQVYILEVFGSEYLILSQDENHAFVCNGFQGILIVDIQNKLNPQVIGSQSLDGWAQSVISLFDEKYLLVSQIEKGEIAVVNIENLANPYIQSKLNYQQESSQSVCLTNDGKTALSIGNRGMRSLPISTDLILHTQIQVQFTDAYGMNYYQDLNLGERLLVGQFVQVFFVPLFIQQEVRISNVYYYKNFQQQTLPNWISFYQQTNSLQIQVDKTAALNTFSKDRSGENILILECLISLSSSNFITQNINAALATQIYTTLDNLGYIDSDGFMTSQLNPTKSFYLNFFDNNQFTQSNVGTAAQIEQIQQDILQILVFSKVSYPIRLFIKGSLFFNYQNRTSAASTVNLIVSPSQQISILLQIHSNGIFVKRNFDGVLTTFSDDLTSLKFQGQTYYVNQIATNNILIANQTSELSNISIDIILQDSSNYDIFLTLPLTDLPFFQLYKPLERNPQKRLQSQLEKQFPSGSLQVESRFQFSFDMGSFLSHQDLTLSYTAYFVKSPNQIVEIISGDWVEFNSFNLAFSGEKSISSLREKYTIRLVASDGYSTVYDEFSFQFNSIPLTYIIEIIVQIAGPIVGVLGIWKYRADIYLILMEKKYMYGSETAVIGKMYRKQIVLMNEMHSISMDLWKQFLKENKDFKKELIAEYNQNQTIDIQIIMAQLYYFYSNNPTQFTQIDPLEFEFLDSRLVRLVKRFCYEVILKENKLTQQALKLLKEFGMKRNTIKDWYKSYIQVNYKFEIQDNQVVRGYDNNFQQPNTINNSPGLQYQNIFNHSKFDQFQNSSPTSEKYKSQIQTCEEDGVKNREINLDDKDKLVENSPVMQPLKFDIEENQESPKMHQFQPEIQKQYFFKQKSRVSRQNSNLKPTKYAQIGQDEEIINLNPFPQMTLQMDKIEHVLQNEKPDLKWDKNLLCEILILEASGISYKGSSRVNPANGESIDLHSHQLLRLEVFKREEEACCQCLRSFFKIDYSRIGLSENNPLPPWLNCSIIDDIIHLWGTPSSHDEPEIQIRVVDQLAFSVMCYNLTINDKAGNNLKDKINEGKIYKIRSENNIVSSMRILQQSQASPQLKESGLNVDQSMKTLLAIPKLSKFCNELPTQQYHRRMRSGSVQQSYIRSNQLNKNELITVSQGKSNDENTKKLGSSQIKIENGIIHEAPFELELAESKQSYSECSSINQSKREEKKEEDNKIENVDQNELDIFQQRESNDLKSKIEQSSDNRGTNETPLKQHLTQSRQSDSKSQSMNQSKNDEEAQEQNQIQNSDQLELDMLEQTESSVWDVKEQRSEVMKQEIDDKLKERSGELERADCKQSDSECSSMSQSKNVDEEYKIQSIAVSAYFKNNNQ